MANIQKLPHDGTIDADGRKFRYGQWWDMWTMTVGRESRKMVVPDWHIEAENFCNLRKGLPASPGHESPFSHFKKYVSLVFGGDDSLWPFEWNPNAEKMLEYKLKHRFLTIAGHGSSGKCLAPNTLVLMFDGTTKKASEIQVGDRLMGDDSTARTVLSTNTGRSNMVRITPRKGDPWECNDDHILTLKRTWATRSKEKPAMARQIGKVIDISVKDYLAKGVIFKDQYKLFSVGVEFDEQPLEFAPRAYGIWLGDGGTGKSSFTSSDSEREVNAYMRGYFEGAGYTIKRVVYGEKCPTWLISKRGQRQNPFLDFALKSSGMTKSKQHGEKRILPQYLKNSRSNRLELLAGLIDSDGHASDTYFEIACSLDGLTQDIAFLARSLGFRVRVKARRVKCKGKWCRSNRINIIGNVAEIPTLRKRCTTKKRTKFSTAQYFKVEQLGVGNWAGFTLDGNGRFLLSDFTVTHNTEFLALWAVCNFLFHPRDVKCLVTSLTLKSAKGKIWGSVAEAWQQAARYMGRGMGDEAHGEKYLPGRLLSQGNIRYEWKGMTSDKAGIELVPGDSNKAKDSSEKIQGYHRGAVFALLDELATLDHGLTNTIESNLFTNFECDVTGSFNPDSHYDPAGKFSEPKEGWKSISDEDEGWETRYGYCLRFRGRNSPNVVAGANIWRGLLTRDAYEEAKDRLGEESKEFCKMFEGRWCPTGSLECIYDEATIINFECDQNAKTLKTVNAEWMETPTPCCGFDPSYAHGGDRAIAYFGRCGRARINGAITMRLEATDYVRIDAKIDSQRSKDEQVVSNFIAECKKRGVHPRFVAMDVGGAGAPLYSLLARDWSPEILQVNSGEVASMSPVSALDPRPCRDRYERTVSEIWYQPKMLMRTGQLKGLHPDCITEMVMRTYETLAGKIKVESKDDMRKRTQRSPDISDAFMLMVHGARMRLGLTSTERNAYSLKPSRAGAQPGGGLKERLSAARNPGINYSASEGSVLWNGRR